MNAPLYPSLADRWLLQVKSCEGLFGIDSPHFLSVRHDEAAEKSGATPIRLDEDSSASVIRVAVLLQSSSGSPQLHAMYTSSMFDVLCELQNDKFGRPYCGDANPRDHSAFIDVVCRHGDAFAPYSDQTHIHCEQTGKSRLHDQVQNGQTLNSTRAYSDLGNRGLGCQAQHLTHIEIFQDCLANNF